MKNISDSRQILAFKIYVSFTVKFCLYDFVKVNFYDKSTSIRSAQGYSDVVAPGSWRRGVGSGGRQTVLEGFLPAVSRCSDKYERTPETGSLYFVIFGRIVGLVAVSHSKAAPDPKSPPAAGRGHIGAYWDTNRGKSCLFQIFPRPGFGPGLHRIT